MKTILLKNSFRIALAAILLPASVTISQADVVFYQNTFDDITSFQNGTDNFNPPPIAVIFEYGSVASHSIAWVTNDAAGNPNSGSVQCSWTWDATQTNGAASAFRFDLFTFVGTMTNASSLSFDIMLAPTPPNQGLPGNDHGYFQWVTRGPNYEYNTIGNFGEGLLAAAGGTNVWTHVTIPLSGANTTVRGLTFQVYNDQFRQIIGTETLYIDNLTLSVPGAVVPPTNYISPAGTKGLHMLTTPVSGGDAQRFERQGIRTPNFSYGWVGSGANPVTYALTVASSPGPAYTNFLAYMYLVPTNAGTGGPTENYADYLEQSAVVFNIQNNGDGTYNGQITYKQDTIASSGYTVLTNVTSSTALGTWTVTFNNDDNITIQGPTGPAASTSLPGGMAAGEFNQVGIYLGTMPNSTNNTGQENVFSQFQVVSNGVPLLNETFSTPTLSSTWAMAADDQGGMLQVPPNTTYLLTWTLPDGGFSLQTTTNLANSGSWHNPGMTKSTFNGKAMVLIPSTMVATNNPAFFRLIKP